MHWRVAQLRALAHPARLRMLSLLTAAPMTAADIARELSLTHANASYHLRQLAAAGTIEVAGEERIRGGVAKRYRYRVVERDHEPRDDNGESNVVERQALFTVMANELIRRVQGLKDKADGSLMTDADLWVTPEVWADIKNRVYDAAHDLHMAAQPPRTPDTVRVNATIALFEMEPDA